MSFEQGLSGLNAASANLGAIGNNVANANTVGFKQSQAQFADMFAASLTSGGAGQVGTGVSVSTVAQQFTQGNITATTNSLDTAINGQGFFQLTNTNGTTTYSRNGQFQLDKNGYLINAQKDKVNGYMPNAAGTIVSGAVVPIQINPANLQPKPTATSVIGVNLPSSAAVPITSTFNPTDPTSYTNSTSLSVYDSLGVSHIGTMYFARLPLWSVGTSPVAPTLSATTTTTATLGSTAGLAVGNAITFSDDGSGAVPPLPVTVTISSINASTGVISFTALTKAPGGTVTTNAPSANWNSYISVDGNTVPAVATNAAVAILTAGATTVTPASVAGLTVGSVIKIAGNPGDLTISDITAGLVTFSPKTTAPIPLNAEITGVTPLTQLTFDTSGKLVSSTSQGVPSATLGSVASSALFPASKTVDPTQNITFNFNSLTSPSTEYGSAFSVNTLTQDGYTTGQLNSTKTGADGIMTGSYSNGQTRALAQLVMANFAGVQGLQSVGNNAWIQTSASGQPLVGTPGSGSLGVLQASSTEDSNVDLTAALVNMITAQRSYQANAQTIKTEDQIMQTVINLR